MALRASVVVPTFRRPESLSRCLAALCAQAFDPAAYEVIVADDAASDEARLVVTCWAERAAARGLALRYVPVTGAHGPAAARNAGWRAAHGPIIAFTDDDCLPTPDWLAAGVAAFVDGVAGASGRVIVPLPSVPTDYERNAAAIEQAEFVTANCFYRRDVLAAVDGFDERFAAPWREDSDLFFTLLGCNARLVHVPEAAVIHAVRPARWGVSMRQQRKSMFNALLYKKHPVLYRRKIQAAPPWRYYCCLLAALAALGGVLGGDRRLACGAASLWMVLTGGFCVRRLQHTSRAPGHVAEMIVTSALIPPLAIFWRLRGALKFRVLFI